jgi:hypothetical protein
MRARTNRLLVEGALNFCYCDESGTGNEPIATMVGVLVDAGRMHLTKADWCELLELLNKDTRRPIKELHAADFYAGNGVWRGMDGPTRALVITEILDWLGERHHHIVYSSVNKALYREAYHQGNVPRELRTIWRLLGFHLVLAVQRYSQPEKKNKGNTYFVFDNEVPEASRFPELIVTPPSWSDEYYGRGEKDDALNQVIDVPVFSDSKAVPLLQVADFLAFLLRRYAEIQEGLVPPKYRDEEDRIMCWAEQIQARSIGRAHVYPRRGRNEAQDMFYRLAPPSLRDL